MALITVCRGTPIVRVRDNRGHVVRTLRYNRNEPGDVASQYVERNAFNALGQPASSQDARFFAQGGGSPTLNFQHTPALSGQVLQTISADAGQTQTFYDIAGRRVWQRDARGTIQQFTYDALGRPLSRTETLDGQAAAVRERRVYGDTAAPAAPYDASDKTDPRNLNQRGHIIQHYDPAGLLDTREAGYTVLGAPQRQDRTLLPAEIPSDWTDAAVANWQATLAAKTATVYPTTWAYNAVGQALEQTDARGHRRRSAYDIAGRKSASWVTPQGQPEQTITTSIAYAAGGQIETRADANGVTTDYTYEPQNSQRVLTIKVARKPSGGAPAILQDLSYAYDPVGNVIGLNDGAQAPAYFKNRAVSAARAYTYDALYQLISASGRENAVATPSGTDSPQAFTPLNTANYRPYTRRYAYDLGGNLTQIVPGNSLPNRGMTVAAASNRAVSNANAQSVTAATVANYFDAAGNANCLDGNPTRPMRWSGLNQLGSLVTIQRSAQDQTQNDRESYAYGGDGERARKTGFAKTSSGWNQADVIYLPGLEIRSQSGGEQLEVIVLDDGARMLNWRMPAPDGVKNQQLRYQYRERQGSCQIEADDQGAIITQEEYYPYGGTAVWAAASTSEVKYKTIRYSGKERDAAGLYYYGFRYYQSWIGRWINPDPAGTVDGLNLYCMVGNNPVTLFDSIGLMGNCIGGRRRRDSTPEDIQLAERGDESAEKGRASAGQIGKLADMKKEFHETYGILGANSDQEGMGGVSKNQFEEIVDNFINRMADMRVGVGGNDEREVLRKKFYENYEALLADSYLEKMKSPSESQLNEIEVYLAKKITERQLAIDEKDSRESLVIDPDPVFGENTRNRVNYVLNNLRHKEEEGYIVSSDAYYGNVNTGNIFVTKFDGHKWSILSSYRNKKNSNYYASDVVLAQYMRMKERGLAKLDDLYVIERHAVVNKEARRLVEPFLNRKDLCEKGYFINGSKEFEDVFLNKIPNGKSTRQIVEAIDREVNAVYLVAVVNPKEPADSKGGANVRFNFLVFLR